MLFNISSGVAAEINFFAILMKSLSLETRKKRTRGQVYTFDKRMKIKNEKKKA